MSSSFRVVFGSVIIYIYIDICENISYIYLYKLIFIYVHIYLNIHILYI
jgi:hypothetical protein